MIERLRYLKRMFHSHSFFGWKGYFHLVDLQCKIQNATGTELWNLYEEQHKIMYDYIDRNLKLRPHRYLVHGVHESSVRGSGRRRIAWMQRESILIFRSATPSISPANLPWLIAMLAWL